MFIYWAIFFSSKPQLFTEGGIVSRMPNTPTVRLEILPWFGERAAHLIPEIKKIILGEGFRESTDEAPEDQDPLCKLSAEQKAIFTLRDQAWRKIYELAVGGIKLTQIRSDGPQLTFSVKNIDMGLYAGLYRDWCLLDDMFVLSIQRVIGRQWRDFIVGPGFRVYANIGKMDGSFFRLPVRRIDLLVDSLLDGYGPFSMLSLEHQMRAHRGGHTCPGGCGQNDDSADEAATESGSPEGDQVEPGDGRSGGAPPSPVSRTG